MVIVYPDKVTILDFLGDRFGKEAVCFFVGIPRRFIKGNLARMIMEQRPKDGVLMMPFSKCFYLRSKSGSLLEKPL